MTHATSMSPQQSASSTGNMYCWTLQAQALTLNTNISVFDPAPMNGLWLQAARKQPGIPRYTSAQGLEAAHPKMLGVPGLT